MILAARRLKTRAEDRLRADAAAWVVRLRRAHEFVVHPPLMVVAFSALIGANVLLTIIAIVHTSWAYFAHRWTHPEIDAGSYDLIASAAGAGIAIFVVLYFTVLGPALDSDKTGRGPLEKMAHLNTWLLFAPGVFLVFPFAVLSGTAYGFPRYPGVILTYALLSPPTAWSLIRLVQGLYTRPEPIDRTHR